MVCKHTNGVMTIMCAIHTFVLTVHVPNHGHIKLSIRDYMVDFCRPGHNYDGTP